MVNTRLSFSKAQRKQVKLKLAITGPSGSGKTYSALLLASGLGKKIALIDTENDSASLYSDKFEFDSLNLTPPYSVDRYKEGIAMADAAGYDVLVIDQISHAWSGEGGLLAEKEALDARGGNSYANWARLTPKHEKFKSYILNAGLHVICTMRSKQDYVLEQNSKGRSAPRKVGLAPIQRDGMEYEFTTVLDIAMDHNAQVSKDRTGLFDGQTFKITKKTGEQLLAWLESAPGQAVASKSQPRPIVKAAPKPVVSAQTSASGGSNAITKVDQQNALNLATEYNLPHGELKKYIQRKYAAARFSALSRDEYIELCKSIEGHGDLSIHDFLNQSSLPLKEASAPVDFDGVPA